MGRIQGYSSFLQFLFSMFPPSTMQTPEIKPGEQYDFSHWLDGFLHHAKLHPEKIALIAGTKQMSYSQLDKQSNGVARRLLAKGIGHGDFVGVGFPRSLELIVSMLGIIKSGAAYVPIDPGYPQARIAAMISSARIKSMVGPRDLTSQLNSCEVIAIEEVGDSAPCSLSSASSQPIYAIFTSGSTGEPKAASVFHAGFSNLLEWYRTELSLAESDRTLVISSPSFDLTQKNLFTPLLTGGTLVLDDCQTYDITRILGLIREHGITLINCTPSAFYPLVDAAGEDFAALSSLRWAVLGGEPISVPRLRSWLEHPSCKAEVVNSYGPTECTDICLFHRLHRGNLDQFPFVPLGLEIPNVQVSIRDEDLSLLKDGETGELCIGGAGVGGGYLYDPEKTADRFVGGIYRTGDLAKKLPCGTFEFRGRADHQVKVNGFRIELGEIEIALNDLDGVTEAVVTASENKLTAHVQGTANAADMKMHLAARLPAYMIPSDFVMVEKFPLTPNGKVDRKALVSKPTPEAVSKEITDTSLESKILALWSDILGTTITDATANFFDIGGNSIHLAVVHVKLREITGKDFPITDLFAQPSARAIAAHLSPRKDETTATGIQDRARLAKAGFARFQRPLKR
jgi:amino acid adenylation domain-containing protein